MQARTMDVRIALLMATRSCTVEGDDYKGRMLLFMVGHIMHGKQLDPRAMQQWYRWRASFA